MNLGIESTRTHCWILTWQEHCPAQQVFFADQAMAGANLQPVSFQAKEALSAVNGTAVSIAAKVHLLHGIHQLSHLTRLTMAIAVEALLSSLKRFDPVFTEWFETHSGFS